MSSCRHLAIRGANRFLRGLTSVSHVALLLLLASMPALSQDAPPQEASPAPGWTRLLDQLAEADKTDAPEDAHLAELRQQLEALRGEIRKWVDDRSPALKAVQDELTALGPPPTEGTPAETPAIASERARLNTQQAEIEGQLKQAELILNRVNSQLADLAAVRRDRFTAQMLTRRTSPLSPDTWAQALPQLATAVLTARQIFQQTATSPSFRQQLRQSALPLVATLIVAITLAIPLARWLLRRYGRDPTLAQPGFIDIARATLTITTANALLPTIAATLVYMVATEQGILSAAGNEIAESIFIGFLLFIWIITFFRAALAPLQPAWRLAPVPNDFARGVRGIVIAMALVFASDIVLSQMITVYGAKLEVLILRDFLITLVVTAILLILLLRQRIWRATNAPAMKPRWPVIRSIIAAMLLVNLLAGMFGYVALARFVATQAAMSGALLFLILILHKIGRELIGHTVEPDTWIGQRLRTSFSMDDRGAARVAFWLGLAYDAAVLGLGSIIGLFVWGAEQADVAEWTYQVLFGLQIGKLTFSLVDVMVALLVFMALVLVTRLVKRVLTEQLFPQTQLDKGTQQSIITAIGYLGFIVAAIASVSALGLTMTNLAIVAGALSVGIGFGLQNVVNNFVSGIILLVERPVKVGDWVVVGEHQGYVSRIKVRATELTTFDRSNVFVPNSELISRVVTNMTYADKLGRIIIPVGIAYGSDARKAQQLLIDVANAHPAILDEPAPAAMFRGFGDSALDFELRCFLEDVENTIGVTSDLCFAIEEAFRREGIEIPFPQQDVHVRQFPHGPAG